MINAKRLIRQRESDELARQREEVRSEHQKRVRTFEADKPLRDSLQEKIQDVVRDIFGLLTADDWYKHGIFCRLETQGFLFRHSRKKACINLCSHHFVAYLLYESSEWTRHYAFIGISQDGKACVGLDIYSGKYVTEISDRRELQDILTFYVEALKTLKDRTVTSPTEPSGDVSEEMSS